MSSKFRAVLFDFDGTLADSYDAITASVNHVRAGHALPPLPVGDVRRMVGHGILQLMADIAPGDPAANAAIYRAHHPSVMYEHTRLLPGVREALRQLSIAGVKLAVCSNKPAEITRKLLEALHISDLFDAALGPEDAGKPKPDPAMLVLALERLGIAKADALYIGDMPLDVETARRAGVAVWVVSTGSSDAEELRRAQPDRLLESLADLASAVMTRP
jgi:2-phosphoglycolate phosphatase